MGNLKNAAATVHRKRWKRRGGACCGINGANTYSADQMTYSPKIELVSTLNSSALLKGLTSGGIHNLVANDVSAFPRVVFSEIQDADADFADNEVYSFEVRYQISIFTQASTRGKETAIASEIDRLMREIGYSRYDSQDLYETDTKVFHKARRYKKTYYQEVN
ncbi:DUF3168 domain-containing protein [Bacillus sp. PW192]|nr:DUF3168 domain-containing protein [Bacillus sp. PW192]